MGLGSSRGGPSTLSPNPPNLPNAWIYSSRIVDAAGHSLSPQTVATQCPNLGQAALGPPASGQVRSAVPDDARNAVQNCVTKLSSSYHLLTTYQPANRYWLFQGLETAIYLALALASVAVCFYWVRRRA